MTTCPWMKYTPGCTSTGSPIDTCPVTIARRWQSRGRSGTPRACRRALARYRAWARKASVAQDETQHLKRGVEAGPELVPLETVGGRHPRVRHERLTEAGVGRADPPHALLSLHVPVSLLHGHRLRADPAAPRS